MLVFGFLKYHEWPHWKDVRSSIERDRTQKAGADNKFFEVYNLVLRWSYTQNVDFFTKIFYWLYFVKIFIKMQ